MALAPLADTSDLPTAWSGNGEAARALDVASAAIRDAAGNTISAATSTVVVHGGSGQILGLPGPVTAVASVLFDGSALASDCYEVLPNGLWRRAGWAECGRPVPVTVTYTHGLTAVPADIVDLTCLLAVAWLEHRTNGGGSSTAGLKDARIDDAAEGYTDERAGQVSPVYIPEATRNWLAGRFGGGVEVVEFL